MASSRLANLAAHFISSSFSPGVAGASSQEYKHRHNFHSLSPTFFLPRAAAIEPDAIGIHHTSASNHTLRRTYAQWAARSCALAYFFKKRGYKRVGILMPNTPAFLEAIFGIAAAGAVQTAANYRLKKDDIAYIFEHSDCDCILVDQEFVVLLESFRERHPNVALIVDADTMAEEGEYEDAIKEGAEYDRQLGGNGWQDLETQAGNEEDVIALAYTSGTTARPKGVEYTHRGVYLAMMGNVVESGLVSHTGRCKYLWTLPLFHAAGWTFPWAVTAARGSHYCLRKIDYPQIWRLMKEEGITHFNAAPTVNTLLCADKNAERLPQFVRVTVAASPPSAHLFEQMTDLNLHPVHVYGMTETYGPITKGYYMPAWDELPPKEKYARMARQGHGFIASLPARVIKTDVQEGELVDVKKNGHEIGEIVLQGNICAKGYYKDPEATRKLFAGGVLHTGDLAVWHPDGSVQVLDRAKDIIISGGENISSVSLEGMLMKHPAILEAACIGVPHEKWGETPKAFITVQQGKQVRGEDIVKWAKNESDISGFMIPREVEILRELPKTSTGKVKKNVLREWAKGADRDKVN